MIEHRRHLQSRLWHLAAKYNVIIDEVGWRYLGRVEHLLISRLPIAVHLETRLLIGQIRQVQHDVTLIEKDITAQVQFNPSVDLLKDLPGFGLVCSWTIMCKKKKRKADSAYRRGQRTGQDHMAYTHKK